MRSVDTEILSTKIILIIKMNKKNSKVKDEEVVTKKKTDGDLEEDLLGEEGVIDQAIIEDTFTEEFSEYNDVDNF